MEQLQTNKGELVNSVNRHSGNDNSQTKNEYAGYNLVADHDDTCVFRMFFRDEEFNEEDVRDFQTNI